MSVNAARQGSQRARLSATSSFFAASTLPGVLVIDKCPWKRVLEYWPAPFPSLADAAIVAVAASKRYDAIATFDQKLGKRQRPRRRHVLVTTDNRRSMFTRAREARELTRCLTRSALFADDSLLLAW